MLWLKRTDIEAEQLGEFVRPSNRGTKAFEHTMSTRDSMLAHVGIIIVIGLVEKITDFSSYINQLEKRCQRIKTVVQWKVNEFMVTIDIFLSLLTLIGTYRKRT